MSSCVSHLVSLRISSSRSLVLESSCVFPVYRLMKERSKYGVTLESALSSIRYRKYRFFSLRVPSPFVSAGSKRCRNSCTLGPQTDFPQPSVRKQRQEQISEMIGHKTTGTLCFKGREDELFTVQQVLCTQMDVDAAVKAGYEPVEHSLLQTKTCVHNTIRLTSISTLVLNDPCVFVCCVVGL